MRDCPVCGESEANWARNRELDALALLEKRQNARFEYWRQRDDLVHELTDRGFIANVTLDGSVIITGRRP